MTEPIDARSALLGRGKRPRPNHVARPKIEPFFHASMALSFFRIAAALGFPPVALSRFGASQSEAYLVQTNAMREVWNKAVALPSPHASRC